jgi:SAM-dependent methyltransferase
MTSTGNWSLHGLHQSQKADIETSSDEYAGRFVGQTGEYILKVQADVTLSLLRPWSGCRVVDVGGGHGQIAVPLVHAGFDVTVAASDLSCRKRLDSTPAAGSFRFDVCNLLALPYPDKSFDAAVAFRLLPHEENWPRQIAELCRVAKHAVIVDYPDLRSFNLLYKWLFAFKKAFEKNTREFMLFRRRQIVDQFRANDFPAITLRPQFFAPLVVHRFLGHALLSQGIESAANALGLTHLFGSPIVVRACAGESGTI